MPLSYGDLDAILGRKKEGLSFTMVFEEGGEMAGHNCDPTESDDDIIAGCNATNPKNWGKVVAIKDKKRVGYWGKGI